MKHADGVGEYLTAPFQVTRLLPGEGDLVFCSQLADAASPRAAVSGPVLLAVETGRRLDGEAGAQPRGDAAGPDGALAASPDRARYAFETSGEPIPLACPGRTVAVIPRPRGPLMRLRLSLDPLAEVAVSLGLRARPAAPAPGAAAGRREAGRCGVGDEHGSGDRPGPPDAQDVIEEEEE